RILAQASECVKPGGYIAYMTCTFAPEENEKNIEWFLRKFPEFEAVKAPHLESYQSHLADFPCYRIWPHRVPSAGAFTALLKSKKEAAASFVDVDDLTPIWKS
ncbi:MAG TPA: hypothetical protein VFV50_03370, partial [Bdellovibrionales bacterium]|nr:hypothetical protein [Bdellovibrionales bacterium]